MLLLRVYMESVIYYSMAVLFKYSVGKYVVLDYISLNADGVAPTMLGNTDKESSHSTTTSTTRVTPASELVQVFQYKKFLPI